MGVLFDGTDDELLATISNWRSADTSGTMAAWIKRAATGVSHAILSSSDQATNTGRIQFYVRSTDLLTIFLHDGTNNATYSGNTSLADTNWHHVAIAANGTTWYGWVDGVAQTMSKVASGGTDPHGKWLNAIALIRDNVTIGDIYANSTRSGLFNGIITDVAVWNAALTTEQVGPLAASRLKRMALQIAPANLVAYWSLNEVADGASADGATFYDRINAANLTGDNGAGNTGLTGAAETYLSYP